MDRLACVDLPALPLQLLRRRHQEWAAGPMAVVERDKPLAPLLWVNEEARKLGVLAGQRYAAALALCPSLRAGEITAADIAAAADTLTEKLRAFSPGVEPSGDEPGVFWLDASGFSRLHPSLATWAQRIRRMLAQEGFAAHVAVGFSRFGVYACAKAARGVVSFDAPEDEEAAMRRVRLDRVGIAPEARDTLARLAVRTVGEFLALPSAGILKRFGPEAHRLQRLASGRVWAPLQPKKYVEPLERTLELDDAESNVEGLMFLVKQQLDPLLAMLAARGEALAELTLTLDKDHVESIRPAAPTLDAAQLLGLVRLRLESLQVRVIRLKTEARGVLATVEQLQMFAGKPRRDLAAAARALARVRAALGAQAVVRARLCEGHLPEARFTWEPMEEVPAAKPRALAPVVVRRIVARPVPLPMRQAREPDGWLLDDPRHGPVEHLDGPYLVEGGWWRGEVRREYYFAELRSGAIYWIYFDRKRRRWYRQGCVA